MQDIPLSYLEDSGKPVWQSSVPKRMFAGSQQRQKFVTSAVGLSSLLGFASVTCGPSAYRHQAVAHEDLFCMASRNLRAGKAGWLFWVWFFWRAYVLLGLYYTVAFLSHVFPNNWIICVLPRHTVELSRHSRVQGCGQPLKQLPPASAGWSRLNPCTSGALRCWVQMFVLVTRAGFFEPEERGHSGTSWVWIWTAEEKGNLPATLPAEAVVLCLHHPIQRGELIVKSKQEAAFACIFL